MTYITHFQTLIGGQYMKNKTVCTVVVTLFLALILVGCGEKPGTGDALQGIKAKGKFVVGLDDSFPPMGFRNEAGTIVGFDIDLAKEVARRLGVEVEFKAVDWDGVIFSLKNRDIDLIWNGLTITPARDQQIDFSKPYLENRQIIVVAEGSSLQGKVDLKGKIVGYQMGSSSETALNGDVEIAKAVREVRKFSNNTEALLDLQAGRVDAVIVDEIVGRYYMAKRPGIYRVLADDFGKEAYGVGVRDEDDSFREELDRVLDAMKKDGTAARIAEEWFGENIIK